MTTKRKMKSGNHNVVMIYYRNLVRPIWCCSWLLLLLLLFFICMAFFRFHTVTVHVGDYYHVQVLHNISEIMEHREEEVGMQEPVYKNRKLKATGSCSNKDISISQSTVTTPGIPEFIVQIVNTCMSGCSPSQIHVHCGWFASAKMVNPKVFRRIKYDDCLVNGGRPLKSSQIIRFTYSNTFLYPLSFKSANFC